MVADPLFRRLDRARLDATLTRRVLAAARPRLDALVAGHVAFRDGAGVAALTASAQRLVELLCDEFVLARKRVVLRDEPRPHRRRGGRIVYELHGRCQKDGAIDIYVRTAAQERPIAFKSLLDTLLHEFVHHHDFDAFGASVHCGGFYERLGQLYRPMKMWGER
ncbi:MAG: hypothetical protein EXS13_00160 [Planctomycetes bacterium]|nr:hypothetical protein [Planctomycetota bacterium]